MSLGERTFALLIRLYPREFRNRYRDDLLAFFRQDREHGRYGSGLLRPFRFWTATVRDLARAVWTYRRTARREAAISMPKRARVGRLRRDLRFAWRGLWAAPGVTSAALAVLIVGIGASTAIFSVVDAVVLRGLPYPGGDRLASVTIEYANRPAPMLPPDYFDLRARQTSFEREGASAGLPPQVTVDEPVVTLTAVRVTASLFETLGVKPARGRTFAVPDERADAPPVAIISDALWRSRFGADPTAVGQTIALKTGPVTVVGIMPPGFIYPIRAIPTTVDMWVPFIPTPVLMARAKTRNYMLTVIGRLKPGVTLEQASVEMRQIRDAIAAENPGWLGDDQGVQVRRLQDTIVGASLRSWMLLLLGAVIGVMLIACLNVANLLVARAVTRGPELAVRTALGASRWDLSRALVVESVLLSLIGGIGGILAAFWGVDLLRASLPAGVPRLASVAVDLRVMVVALSAASVTGVVFGALPALQASRCDVVTLVVQGGRSQSANRTGRRIRTALMIAEVAIATVLVAGSGLFLSSFARVVSIDLGFDPRHVVAFFGSVMNSQALTPSTTPDARAAAVGGQAIAASALERIRAVPGVVAAEAMQGGRPLSRSWVGVDVQHADLRSEPFTGPDAAKVRSVGPRYLDVVRGRLLQGRWIADADVTGAPPVVVLGDEAARRYFGSRGPVGQTILMQGYSRQVIGVVAAMRWEGPETGLSPEVYIPFAQTSHDGAELMVRTAPDPALVLPALKEALRAAMPGAIIPEPTFLEQSYAALLAQRRFNMVVLALFGVVAIAVAAIGIYGLMAFVVAQRRREIGVRVALGAAPTGILRMVLGSAAALMAAGLAIGIGAALLLEQTVRTFLFDPARYDPVVYGGVAALLFAVGLFAALGPARRAARVDPVIALRAE
jgi:putative ABC transport system permease protein